MKAIRPTFLLAPPRVWERIFTSITAEVEEAQHHREKDCSTARLDWAPRSRGSAKKAKPVPKRMLALAEDRRPFGVFEDSRAFRRADPARGFGRRAAGQRPGAILRGHRHAAHRRLRAHRRRRGLLEPYRSSEVRQHRREAARRGTASGRRWRASDQEPDSLLRLLNEPDATSAPSCAMAGFIPATSPSSIPTVTSTSRAARRSSSFRRTARRFIPRESSCFSRPNRSSIRLF